ncbi:hypothetical protein [Burkholderia sp. WSM2230]|uniref:hypothetical protein n=1 Tax=Burkholderia sp. WSM2230 TaxID=944435 RepID=UPI0012EB68A2|nr:hypothetical protein [Burkholderia sp. WSM2230]
MKKFRPTQLGILNFSTDNNLDTELAIITLAHAMSNGSLPLYPKSIKMFADHIVQPLSMTLLIAGIDVPKLVTAKNIIFDRCLHNEFDTKLPVVTLAHATEQCVFAVPRKGDQVAVFLKDERPDPVERIDRHDT